MENEEWCKDDITVLLGYCDSTMRLSKRNENRI
jgi:hypothetical protein